MSIQIARLYSNEKTKFFSKKKAFENLVKSAQQGHTPSYMKLGKAYFYGKGCKENGLLAYQFFEKALPDKKAQYYISICYLTSSGVQYDIKKTIEFLQKSIDQDTNQHIQ